jgi:hypothetical protein
MSVASPGSWQRFSVTQLRVLTLDDLFFDKTENVGAAVQGPFVFKRNRFALLRFD